MLVSFCLQVLVVEPFVNVVWNLPQAGVSSLVGRGHAPDQPKATQQMKDARRQQLDGPRVRNEQTIALRILKQY